MTKQALTPAVLVLTMPFYPIRSRYDRRTLYPMDSTALMEDYVRALRREIESSAADYDDCEIRAVKVGGGIAGHAADEELGKLLRDLRELFTFSEDAQMVLNVHPGMISAETLLACRRGQVDWLSVDYATADPNESEALGRFLPPSAMDTSLLVLRSSSLKLSFDVLLGLPGQSRASLRRTLDTVLGYGAERVVLRRLEAIPGTEFAAKDLERFRSSSSPRLRLPDDSDCENLRQYAEEYLHANCFLDRREHCFTRENERFLFEEKEEKRWAQIGFGLGARTQIDGIDARNITDMEVYLHHSDEPEIITAHVNAEHAGEEFGL